MTSYEEAPATALVATHCCVCGRPLLEAESLASGIGPICAEKTGYGREGLGPELRARVNKLVYQLAAHGKSAKSVPLLAELRMLGFVRIADRIEERLSTMVEVALELRSDGRLQLELPRIEDDEVFRKMRADLRGVPGLTVKREETQTTFRGLPGTKPVTTIPNETKPILALYRVLARHLSGRVARSPKGMFVVPTEAELSDVLAKKEARHAA